MAKFILLTLYLCIQIIDSLSDTSQCQVVCRKTNNKVPKNNNIEIFLEFKKGVIKLPDRSNYIEENNRMITLPNGEIIPEVSLRLPSEFTVDPVAANCGSKEFLSKIKELRKNIKCSPRPIIVDVLSNEGQVVPNKVLTRQCSGLCTGKKICSAVKTVNTSFSVQILSNDGGIKCSTILVPEDTKCRCKCSVTKKDCTANQKYDKKLCQCKCQNEVLVPDASAEYIKFDYSERAHSWAFYFGTLAYRGAGTCLKGEPGTSSELPCCGQVERTHCLKKVALTRQHKWDSKSCSCICMNETPCTTGTFWNKTHCRCTKTSDNG